MTEERFLRVENIDKRFDDGERVVEVLHGVALAMQANEAAAILGPSGSGKSTLLHIIGTLDRPDAGSVVINGVDPFALPEPELARFRNDVVGFVFQDHHLLPQYSVLENVLIPRLAYQQGSDEQQERARYLLDRVGLEHRLDHRPSQLSGGERQRVAIARALINRPSLLLCDEPTGNLDQQTAHTVADLLFELHAEEQNILITVTHSLELAAKFAKQFKLAGGLLQK